MKYSRIEELYHAVIPGRAATKKNSQQIAINHKTGARFPIQSKAWRRYEKRALRNLTVDTPLPSKPIEEPVWLQAQYYLPDRRWWPDLMGLIQGTADLLEDAGVIEDDKQVVWLEGCQIAGLDKEAPRTLVWLYTPPDRWSGSR